MYRALFFFFQAEDGIRDLTVTGVQTCALPISRRRRSRPGAGRAGQPAGADSPARAHHHTATPGARGAWRRRVPLLNLASRCHRRARPGAARSPAARSTRTRGEPAPAGGGLRHQYTRAGTRHRAARGRRRRGKRPDRGAGHRGSPRGGSAAPQARRRSARGGEQPMTANRLVTLYSPGLAIAGPLVLLAVLSADPRGVHQLLEIGVILVAAVALRGLQIPLSKYSYLTQTGFVALTGSLLVGLPAPALAISASVLLADWLLHKKMFRAALVNLGRER